MGMKSALMSAVTLCRVTDIPPHDKLAIALSKMEFSPCLPTQLGPVFGWAPALHEEADELVHYQEGCLLLCLQSEKKSCPASYIKAAEKREIAALKEKGLEVTKEAKSAIKDRVHAEAARQAFPVSNRTLVWIDRNAGLMLIGSVNEKVVKKVIVMYNMAAPSSSVSFLTADEREVSNLMTDWIRSDMLPMVFAFDESTESCFRSRTGFCPQAKFKHESLRSDAVKNVIEEQEKKAVTLPLLWEEKIAFKLSDSLQISGLKFDVDTKEQDGSSGEQAGEQGGHGPSKALLLSAANFIIFTGMMKQFMPDLLQALNTVLSEANAQELYAEQSRLEEEKKRAKSGKQNDVAAN
ncbi:MULTISPECIES: recombination-associated protein RdgC [Aeromonas]|uniref:Recombination-associated protein RdgC n=1 Tax=Aeromonas caviae TaxID=648 RepID=A0AAJ5ZD46_AERCA|nr:recombination-associated protein RdgC [Aeromonas caviae]RWT77756.1 hypothetical protein DN604_07245 [Aeromonas caviae]WFG00305.1 recombination-associated protein RdgC [Aeromonas caviae]WVM48111.1 recombination-associated protein RdgC [Aeromonas hydrophila]